MNANLCSKTICRGGDNQLFLSSNDCTRVSQPHYAQGICESLDYIQKTFPRFRTQI
jgi:hypothetical protein